MPQYFRPFIFIDFPKNLLFLFALLFWYALPDQYILCKININQMNWKNFEYPIYVPFIGKHNFG